MKKLIEWAEGEVSRGRKIALFSVIFSFIGLVILVFIACLGFTCDRLDGFYPYFGSLGGLAITAVGFYTMTSPKKIQENIDQFKKDNE